MANDTGDKSDNTFESILSTDERLDDIMESVQKKIGVFED